MHSRGGHPEPEDLCPRRGGAGRASCHPSLCITEEAVGIVTVGFIWEWGRCRSGSIWIYTLLILLGCVRHWTRVAVYSFFGGGRGTVTRWYTVPRDSGRRNDNDMSYRSTFFTAHLEDQYSAAVSLPPLFALATLHIEIFRSQPFARLAYILSSIHSAPALASITFGIGALEEKTFLLQVHGSTWTNGWREWFCKLRLREV